MVEKNLTYLLKYLSAFDLKLMKLVFCASGTRSAKEAQFTLDLAILLAAIFDD